MRKQSAIIGRFDDLHAKLYECSLEKPKHDFEKRYVLGSVVVGRTYDKDTHSSARLNDVIATFSFYNAVATLLLYNVSQSFVVQTDYDRERFFAGEYAHFEIIEQGDSRLFVHR